ncbi:hypothetical protein [Lysobacter gummosus]|uniref:hypothetical protein n=1 Tax=Lysobacter gummosus TaxID=262324 RepID=UPI00362906E7
MPGRRYGAVLIRPATGKKLSRPCSLLKTAISPKLPPTGWRTTSPAGHQRPAESQLCR